MKGVITLLTLPLIHAFKSTTFHQQSPTYPRRPHHDHSHVTVRQGSDCIILRATKDDDDRQRFVAAPTKNTEIVVTSSAESNDDDVDFANRAATNTVNERLLEEIRAAANAQKYGSSVNSRGKRDLFSEFRSQKSEEERRRSIEEARDLNGVNPLVCIGGAAFAWICAGGCGFLLPTLRLAGVFRNVVVGLTSLASGFFGVVGVGIFLLGVRVAYGVLVGELDPTPIKRKGEEVVLPDVWGLMMGGTRRRGKRGGGGDDLFGL
eukprot:CCRYP_020480-RA/>CCRYP_020480-RA protein AED:0.44 eAED:0.44 QI:0/0/0/1/1/1/2/0/262